MCYVRPESIHYPVEKSTNVVEPKEYNNMIDGSRREEGVWRYLKEELIH